MEACCGAHFLGRIFESQGHKVRLMSPEYVQPYVKAQKTDDRDAEAIAEAATRPTMRFVSLKSEAQLDLQVLHRARERLVHARTALINQLRAVLLERGIIMPKGRILLMRRLEEIGLAGLAISARIQDWLRICSRSHRLGSSDQGLRRRVRRRSAGRHSGASLIWYPRGGSDQRHCAVGRRRRRKRLRPRP